MLGVSSLALSTLCFCSDLGNDSFMFLFCFVFFVCLFVCLFAFVFVCLFAVDHKNQTHITRNYK